MIMYASRTGTGLNLNLMRHGNWRLLVNARGVWRHEGFPYAIDNGAWTSYAAGTPFDEGAFTGVMEKLGAGADWVVLPDVVEDAPATARLTRRWIGRISFPKLAVIQDGACAGELESYLDHVHGYFLGGSTEYKLSTLADWAAWCQEREKYFHVGRVNTYRRLKPCIAAAADSCDGTSATKFAETIPFLTRARNTLLFEAQVRAVAFAMSFNEPEDEAFQVTPGRKPSTEGGAAR